MADEAENRIGGLKQPASGIFALRAVDSADRMTQSLSPWVREMLNSGNAPTAGGSLVHRLMRRRADESVSFLSTLAILRRFHRIATRTSAWKADVGTISPNLFEKFSEVMFKNWDMGANNITALLKINRQEEAIDMPLAGEVGGPAAAAPPRPPANPMANMTMEEIRRRVEEARKFESMSPSAVPNFVKSQDADKPEVRPVGQQPGSRPAPAPQRPTDQPVARSLPGVTPPPPAAPQPPAQQPSPRMMRRRMARQVEYLSMPALEGSDGGNEGGDDGGSVGGGDSEAGPNQQFDTGPPDLGWLFSEPENLAPDWFTPTAEEEKEQVVLRRTSAQNLSVSRVRPRTPRSAATTLSALSPRRVLQPTPARVAHRTARPKQLFRSALAHVDRPRPQGIVQRVFDRLAVSASGQMLASRPHLLLDHIQRQSAAPAQQPQPTGSALPAASGPSLFDAFAFGPEAVSPSILQRGEETNPLPAPVSLQDFALPYPRRLRQSGELPPTALPVAVDIPTTQPNQSIAPAPAAPMQRRVARTRLQPALPQQSVSSAAPRPAASPRRQPRQESQPVARSRALAVLQTRPLHPSPTVMRLISASPILALATPHPHVVHRETLADAVVPGLDSEESVQREDEELAILPEIRHAFEPVSGLWRSTLLRSQPFAPDMSAQEPDTPSLLSAVISIPDLPVPEMIPEESSLRRTPLTQPSPVKAARAFLPPLDLASLQRTAAIPQPRSAAQAGAQPLAQRLPQTVPLDRPVAPDRPPAPVRLPARPITSVRPERSLAERVVRRDFAGARGDLLRAGILAFAPTDSGPSQTRSPRAVGPTLSQRAVVGPQEYPSAPAAERSSATSSPVVTSSPRAQIRLLMQRAAATDGWQPQQPASFLRRPQGLRPPVMPVQPEFSPVSPSPVRTAGASAPRRQIAARLTGPQPSSRTASVRMRLGEAGAMAQHLAPPSSGLEPVSRLQRSTLLSPAASPARTEIASVPPRQAAARLAGHQPSSRIASVRMRLGETGTTAQLLSVPRPALEPVSRLWRAALLSPAAVLPVQGLAGQSSTNFAGQVSADFSAFVAESLQAEETASAATSSPFSPLSPRPQTRPGTSDLLPLASPLRVAWFPAQIPATPGLQDDLLVDRLSVAAPPQRISRAPRVRDAARPVVPADSPPQLAQTTTVPLRLRPTYQARADTPRLSPSTMLAGQWAGGELTLLERVARRVSPQTTPQFRAQRMGRNVPPVETGQSSAIAQSPSISSVMAAPSFSIESGGTSRSDGTWLPRAVLPAARPVQSEQTQPAVLQAGVVQPSTAQAGATQPPTKSPRFAARPAPRLLQRSHRPGQTGQEAAGLVIRRRRAALLAPVSAAWETEAQTVEFAMGESAPAASPLPGLPVAQANTFSFALPSENPTLAPSVQTAPTQAIWPELPLRQQPVPQRVQRQSASALPAGESADAQPASNAGVRQRPVAVRPISQQILRRDFAHTRRDVLQWRIFAPAAPASSADEPLADVQRTAGAALTATLLDLTQQSARRFALPRRGQTGEALADGQRTSSAALTPALSDLTQQPARRFDLPRQSQTGEALADGQRTSSAALTPTPLDLTRQPVRHLDLPRPGQTEEALADGQRTSSAALTPILSDLTRQPARRFALPRRGQTGETLADTPRTLGAALTATLLDLTRQPTHRFGLPRQRQTAQPQPGGDLPLQRAILHQRGPGALDVLSVVTPTETLRRVAPATQTGASLAATTLALPQQPRRSAEEADAPLSVPPAPLPPLVLRQMARAGVGSVAVQSGGGLPTESSVRPAQPSAGDASPRETAVLPAQMRRLALPPGALARSLSGQMERQQVRRRVEPVSELWRSSLLHDEPVSAIQTGRDVAGSASISGDDLLALDGLRRASAPALVPDRSPVSAASAAFASLELALNRLLGGSETARTAPSRIAPPGTIPFPDPSSQPVQGVAGSVRADRTSARGSTSRMPNRPAGEAVQRLEAGGWRFKRSRLASVAPVETVQRALTGLAVGTRRPIPERPRTLLERVLQRDFAGVRVQMASLGPLGIEAAARGNTVYLSREQARLDRPESLALLGHELTHIAAGGAAPLLGSQPVQRMADDTPSRDATAMLPLPLPLAPSLSRQLSRQLVQMSLADEERTAAVVEDAVRQGVGRQTGSPPVRRRSIESQRSAESRRNAQPRRRIASIDVGSRSVAELAQRRLATSHFEPVSQSWPSLMFPPAQEDVNESPQAQTRGRSEDRLELLEDVGWRFKRREQAALSDPERVQRASDDLTARPSGGVPLPLRPRTLMERVLQRDFRNVRLQAAALEPLGVEAAARGQTVYMQRSALAQLERPDNLAILGHELTHVAAASNPPVRRSELNGGAALPGGEVPSPSLPLSLPPISQLQRSVAHEEAAASSVEQSIQSLLRQSAAVQRDPLAPRPATGPVKANGSGHVVNGTAGNGSAPGRRMERALLPALPVVQRRAVQGQTLVPPAGPDVQRAPEQESVMAGVDSASMPVVQRAVGRVSSVQDISPATAPAQTSVYISRFAAQGAGSPVQRVVTEDSAPVALDESVESEEPDWDRLAERIYPLIVRMIRMERERRPL